MSERTASPTLTAASVDRVAAARALLPRYWAGEDVRAEAEQLLAAAVAEGDVAGECAALYVVCAQSAMEEEHRHTRDAATRLVAAAQPHGEAAWESLGRQFLSRAALREGHEGLALHELATAEVLLDDIPPSRELVSALNGIAATYSALSLFEECTRVYARVDAVLRTSTDTWAREATSYNRLSNEATWAAMLLRAGDRDQAVARLRSAIPQARQQADLTTNETLRRGIQLFVWFMALVAGEADPATASTDIEDLCDGSQLEAEPFARFALAWRLAEEDRRTPARDQIERGLAGCRDLDDGQIEAALLWLRARIAVDEHHEVAAIRDVWTYACLEARQVWELRERRLTSARDRAELLRAERSRRDVERLSLEDPLTGAANRRRLDELRDELSAASTPGWASVFYVDIDEFKRVNDRFGHDVGDEVLRRVVTALTERTREGDVLGRYGGDELVLVAPGCDPGTARDLGERLLEAVREVPWGQLAEGLAVRISVGGATSFDQHGVLFEAADDALYDAKHAGRDRAVLAEVAAPRTTDKA